MNIREAAEQVEGAIQAYLSRDEHGMWDIPFQMQRPLILMGPPGIGKTAIVAHIAERFGINFVSYSITHHTRQSALGLPYIAEAQFGDRSFHVSRYTMSEIIAAVYDAIEESAVTEGILFLDEINCASETLNPALLQFLQYKTFGQHRLPEGWIIVCAGNPPEYNRAARAFDPAMMDRLKRIDVEPNFDVWLDYATSHGVHPAIISYLSGKPAHFYRVRATGAHTRIVTARGWEDLSHMLNAYRHKGLEVDRKLIAQYIQDRDIAEDFSLYFELFAKYEDDYQLADILAGTSSAAITQRAQAASFDERIALVNLLLSVVIATMHKRETAEQAAQLVHDDLTGWLTTLGADENGPLVTLDARINELRHTIDEARARGTAGRERQLVFAYRLEMLGVIRERIARDELAGKALSMLVDAGKQTFNASLQTLSATCTDTADCLDHVLSFLAAAFNEGQELLVFCAHIARDPLSMRFIANHGPASFAHYATSLMLEQRGRDLLQQLDSLAKKPYAGNTPQA